MASLSSLMRGELDREEMGEAGSRQLDAEGGAPRGAAAQPPLAPPVFNGLIGLPGDARGARGARRLAESWRAIGESEPRLEQDGYATSWQGGSGQLGNMDAEAAQTVNNRLPTADSWQPRAANSIILPLQDGHARRTPSALLAAPGRPTSADAPGAPMSTQSQQMTAAERSLQELFDKGFYSGYKAATGS